MKEKTKEYREQLAEAFITILEEKQLDWKKEWKGSGLHLPVNAKTGIRYHGINQFYLGLIALERGYTDYRWATFKQTQDKGWKLENAKGHGVKVEYWYPFDNEEKKTITWEEFRTAGGVLGDRYFLRVQYATVFNGSLIAGIPEIPEPELREVSPDALIEKLSVNMNVEIINDGGDRAYYSVLEDKIHLPLPQTFLSDYAYASTALHELAHSTGAVNRLNRDLSGSFGTEEYAFEELIAEISSCFMSVNLQTEQDVYHVENHKAYVQCWVSHIREKPEALVKAIQQAEKAASYMEYQAELIEQKDFENINRSSMEIKEEKQLMINNRRELQKPEASKVIGKPVKRVPGKSR
ncbi:MAG: DUF1738 domain-containing protein [Ruminococcus sp.]|nr:DUF1738 domain-containing protein [Ruminococcus sp.]